MTEDTERQRQTTATISLSAEDKKMLITHAKSMGTSLSSLMLEAALKTCEGRNFKQLIIDLNKDDGYILLPAWMTAEDLKKAAKMLELMEGSDKDSEK